MRHSLTILLLLVGVSGVAAGGPLHRSIELSDGSEMELRVFSAKGEVLMLGFPCDQGTGIAETRGAEAMAAHGIEVWMADLLGAHFLPVAPSSMRDLEGGGVRDLIALAHRETGKQIVLVSSGYGSLPTLRGAKLWLDAPEGENRLGGALLFYPMLADAPPEPGKPVTYPAIVHQTATPVYIFQPELSPTRFWLKRLVKTLAEGGATVKSEFLPGIRPNFYQRPDATEAELAATQQLPEMMLRGFAHLTETRAKE
ncbi:MAG TPA: hypothetical protein VGE00_10135 [Gammaproteobacteria bacterium]